jgi:hypothetical protein
MHNVDAFHCHPVTEEIDKSMLLSNNAKAFLENITSALLEPFAHCSMPPGWNYVTKVRAWSEFGQFHAQFHHICHKCSEMGDDNGVHCKIQLARKLGDQITGCLQYVLRSWRRQALGEPIRKTGVICLRS